jgi:hypothetical protein
MVSASSPVRQQRGIHAGADADRATLSTTADGLTPPTTIWSNLAFANYLQRRCCAGLPTHPKHLLQVADPRSTHQCPTRRIELTAKEFAVSRR